VTQSGKGQGKPTTPKNQGEIKKTGRAELKAMAEAVIAAVKDLPGSEELVKTHQATLVAIAEAEAKEKAVPPEIKLRRLSDRRDNLDKKICAAEKALEEARKTLQDKEVTLQDLRQGHTSLQAEIAVVLQAMQPTPAANPPGASSGSGGDRAKRPRSNSTADKEGKEDANTAPLADGAQPQVPEGTPPDDEGNQNTSMAD